jgi:GNAT superfamily N-acetyltransferase
MEELLRRTRAFEAALAARAVERCEPFARGAAHLTPSLPQVWDLNFLRLDRASDVSAATLVLTADDLQGRASLAHRRIVVPDEREAGRLAPAFRELGWRVERYLTMMARAIPTEPAGVAVEEVALERLRGLRAVLARDAPGGRRPEVVEQLTVAAARHARAGDARHFAVLAGGVPVAAADLYSDGRTAQIEDVATLSDHRRRGYASAIVARAVEAARESGHDLVFLLADADDSPKKLYRRLGFDAIGLAHTFTRAG